MIHDPAVTTTATASSPRHIDFNRTYTHQGQTDGQFNKGKFV